MRKFRESIVVKSIAGIIIPLIILALIVASLGYGSFTNGMLELYEKGAIEIAQTAASEIDADRLDAYEASGGTTEEYLEAFARLDRICNTSDATFVYIIRPDLTDYAHITFLISTINRDSTYTQYDFGYVRETTNDDYKVKYRALYEGTSTSEIVIRDKGYIETDSHITAMVPLKGQDGETKGILCVQRQMENLSSVRNRFLRIVFQTLTLLIILIIVGQHFYLRRVLLKPITTITKEAARFAEEEVSVGRKLTETVKNKDEIGKLAASIDHMEESISRYMEDLTRATAEKERISTELSLATDIQASQLPRLFPAFPNRTEFDVYASMTPAKEVGGDFYDFFLIDQDHIALVMADVSGKGVPAALFMMIARVLLKSRLQNGETPGEALTHLNDQLCESNEAGLFVTVWLAVLEISTGKGVAANAGHEHPAIRRAGGNYELITYKHSLAVAAMAGIPYTEHSFELHPGDSLFVYTDGVTEASNTDRKLFGTDRLLSALNTDPDAEPEQVLANVKAGIDEFVGEATQFDDITMLCLKYVGTDKTE